MPIQLRFSLTFADYMSAQRLHAKKHPWRCFHIILGPYVSVIAAAAILVDGIASFSHHSFSAVDAASIGACSLLFLHPFYIRYQLKSFYRRTRTGDENVVTIGEESIHVKTETTSSEVTWKAIRNHLADAKVVLLYLAPAKFLVIPKHLLTSEQIAELQSLLARKSATRVPAAS